MRAVSAPVAFLVCAAGIGLYSAMDTLMKGLVRSGGVYDAMLWRGLIGCGLSGALYAAMRPAAPSRAILRLHAGRGALMAVMALLFFWGLARVPMAQAVALTFIAPLLSLLLAALILKERIGAATVAASLVALVGVGVIVAGHVREAAAPDRTLGTLAVLGSALLYAFNIVIMRHQAQAAGPVEIGFFQNLFMTATVALAAPWLAHAPVAGTAIPLLAAAALALVSSMLLAWAYARAEASYLSATEYTAFLWAALFGFLVYGEHVSPYTLAGAALIVGGCFAAAWRRPLPPLAAAEAAL